MILKNLTTGRIISKDLKICESFLDRTLGLLNPSNSRTLLFRTRFGIHTFFLREAIDVLVLDQDFKVRDFRISLKPNRVFFWNPAFLTIIELPDNTIKNLRIKKDDLFSIS